MFLRVDSTEKLTEGCQCKCTIQPEAVDFNLMNPRSGDSFIYLETLEIIQIEYIESRRLKVEHCTYCSWMKMSVAAALLPRALEPGAICGAATVTNA